MFVCTYVLPNLVNPPTEPAISVNREQLVPIGTELSLHGCGDADPFFFSTAEVLQLNVTGLNIIRMYHDVVSREERDISISRWLWP